MTSQDLVEIREEIANSGIPKQSKEKLIEIIVRYEKEIIRDIK